MNRFATVAALVLLILAICAPLGAQETKPFAFLGLEWGQTAPQAKAAVADTATYKMEVAAAGATRELFTTTFAGSEAALTLELADGKLSVISLALADARPDDAIGAVFEAWTAELTKRYGPPQGGTPTEKGADSAESIDLFGGMPEKTWTLSGTEILLLQRPAGTGYDVLVTFRRTGVIPAPQESGLTIKDIGDEPMQKQASDGDENSASTEAGEDEGEQ